jgi:hypothetical protein
MIIQLLQELKHVQICPANTSRIAEESDAHVSPLAQRITIPYTVHQAIQVHSMSVSRITLRIVLPCAYSHMPHEACSRHKQPIQTLLRESTLQASHFLQMQEERTIIHERKSDLSTPHSVHRVRFSFSAINRLRRPNGSQMSAIREIPGVHANKFCLMCVRKTLDHYVVNTAPARLVMDFDDDVVPSQ